MIFFHQVIETKVVNGQGLDDVAAQVHVVATDLDAAIGFLSLKKKKMLKTFLVL